ncbi:Dipeptidyl peptidase 4 [Vermiconidia calcicola]|uniref:Dipeptidyl peptidase 4 n=1 Tax=Vermiconidia calcicola TaxID=1690605 RepID=A0ACC3MZ40_9PEZI|nr:Dipeptidyl peptidase 4 [Vermiconidia calcicola]
MYSNPAAFVATWAILSLSATAVNPSRKPYQPTGGGDRILTFKETSPESKFSADYLEPSWLPGDEDGLVAYLSDSGSLVLESYATGQNETLVPAKRIPSDYWEYWIRSDQQKVMFSTNYTKQYRHSYFADYQIFDVESGEITPLVEDQAGDIQYATPNLFHAVPDWVYEEEIFGDRYTLWFSPDAQFLAFLSFNETGVGTFTIPYYMNDSKIAPPYPRELDLRYPKVGTTNPTVMMTILEIDGFDLTPVPINAFPAEDLVVGEVAWATNAHDSLVYHAYNRVQTLEKIVTVSVPSGESEVHGERDGSDGWLDNLLSKRYVGTIDGDETYYLDMSDASGWTHLYLFPVNGPATDNITLSSGEWEVRSVLSVDTERQCVYYTSTKGHSTESHVYNVSYATLETQALVDDSVAGYWDATFSSAGGFYILSYYGPDVPYQELYSVNASRPLRTITSNSKLVSQVSRYNLPNITYGEVGPLPGTNYTMNVMTQFPPNFDPPRKYPVLFTPYGGPGAQEITKTFKAPSWNQYISSDPELEYITYTVDNRGTVYKGRAFRATVTEKLGVLEARDQIWAARDLILRYDSVDADHVGMWGWSYGGFLTCKTLETQGSDAGPFTLGLITAPATDWRFYDTLYTERYMRTPELNPDGYRMSAVRNVTGFRNVAGGFAIMHGTGDDNVHYQQTAALVDLLIGAGISPAKADWRAFTDSDHSINYNGADLYLYRYLTSYLYKEKMRQPEMVEQHQWSRRSVLDLSQ